MHGLNRFNRLVSLALLVMVAAGCGVIPGIGGNNNLKTPNGTQTMAAIGTHAYETAMGAFTEVSFLTPSATNTIVISLTPTPTEGPSPTPTDTLTPTATLYRLPTWTLTPTTTVTPTVAFTLPGGTPGNGTPVSSPTPKPYDCELVSQVPKDGTVFRPNKDFDAKWKVENTGTKTWNASNTDFRYLSGEKMYRYNAYDLPESVKPGEEITLVADMFSPRRAGLYTSYWELVIKDTQICKFYVTIWVKLP